jgi:SAM-dependent methyltransferase
MTDFKRLYDDLYRAGYHNSIGFTHSKRLIRAINRIIPKNNKILDVGCSNGTACLLLNKCEYICSGIDISEVAINIAKSHGISDCKACSADNIDYPDESFDVILSTDVLEHALSTDINKIFTEFSRVTTSSAYYFLRIALKPEVNRKYIKIKKRHKVKNLHTLTRNKTYWLNKFNQHNLCIVKILNKKSSKHLEIIVKKQD